MKKLVIMLVMLFTMSVYSFGENNVVNKVENIEKYSFNVNHQKLANALDLSKDQFESLDVLFGEFENGMVLASEMDSDESRYKVLHNTINTNVRYMRYILNDEQYRHYLKLLNLTLEHRGFDIPKITKNY